MLLQALIRRDKVLKQAGTICMIFLLPAIAIQLLMSLLIKGEFDWEYLYIMAIVSLVGAIVLISVQEVKGRANKEMKFNYIASAPYAPMIVLTFIMALSTAIKVEGLEIETLFIRIIVIAAMISLAFFKYKFYIEEKILTYEIMLFTIPLYKRRVHPDEIKHIKFIRTGWAGKGAIVKVESGFNIRIINFKPATVCPVLNHFAEKHSISISKTYDYTLLDKSSQRPSLDAGDKGIVRRK